MQLGGTSLASAGEAINAVANKPPVHSAARRITAKSPSTKQLLEAGVRKNFAMISGPIPHTSP